MDFPQTIDSTFRSSFTQCETKGKYSGLLHLKPKRVSIHLSAGAAFAHGVETARRLFFSSSSPLSSLDLSAADRADMAAACGSLAAYLACPLEDDSASTTPEKSPERVCFAVIDYFREFPLESDPIRPYINPRGEPAIEYRFALPISVSHPVTREPILYTGRFDMLANFDGNFWPVDEKTTSRLGPTWAQQFDLRGQFLGYCWAVREQGFRPAGCIVRGIGFLKAQTTFQQAVVRFPNWMLDDWYTNLCFDIERMITAWQTGYFSKAYGEACASYSGCEYKQLCQRPNPEEWFDALYERRIWNPLEDVQMPLTEQIISLCCTT